MKSLVFLVVLVMFIQGGRNSPLNKLKPVSNKPNQNFGSSVTMDKTYLIVGAGGMDNNISDVGSITIYAKNFTHTVRMQGVTLTPHDGQKGDRFGRDLDMDEGTIIIGSSKAHIIQHNGSEWSFQQKLVNGCGHSVAIHGDYAVVGCPTDNVVNVYKAPNWDHLRVLEPKGNKNTNFGNSVAMHGSYLVVGSDKAVYIYKVNTWESDKNISHSISQRVGTNGRKISMHDHRLAFISDDLKKTSVYVYRKMKDKWNVEGRISLVTPSCISIYGAHIIIGLEDSAESGVGSGSVYIYKLVSGEWQFHKELFSTDVGAGDRLGSAVAVWDNIFVAGAPYDDDQGINSGAVYLYNSLIYTIQCYAHRYQVTWLKYSISGDEMKITLNEQSCDRYSSNNTHVWVTTRFEDCGTTFVETENHIIVSNTATVTISNYIGENKVIKRTYNHKYNIICSVDRNFTISDTTRIDIRGVVVPIEVLNTTVSMTLELYQSHAFILPFNNDVRIKSSDVMYVGVKIINNNTIVKFIVNHCYASSSSDPVDHDTSAFLRNKCPLDDSFTRIKQDYRAFYFEIRPFDFIKFRKSVYFHCVATICSNDAPAQECAQVCEGNGNMVSKSTPSRLKEVYLTSNKIILTDTLSCSAILCQPKSKCYELQSPRCICDKGRVFSRATKQCLTKRIIKFVGIHLNLLWDSSYENITALNSMQFAVEKEAAFIKLFVQMKTLIHFDGIRITKMRKGSVICDVDVIYSENTTLDAAINEFQTTITTPPSATTFANIGDSMMILTEFIPVHVKEIPKDSNNSRWYIYVIIVLVLFVALICLIVACKRERCRKRIWILQ